ncbi:hypothetical protein [Sulfurimonas sp.]|uniref:hypothetical protein n=1 Tax=Sulfurimonas sp. TaxID=2022749 RepID=UPI0035658D0B
MKKIYMPLLILSAVLSANNDDLSWVDKQVNAIKPPRDGESMRNISSIRNPFVFLKKNLTNKDDKNTKATPRTIVTANKDKDSKTNSSLEKTPVFTTHSFILGAIINNTALINGKWHKIGETINGYKITKINKKTVNLQSGSKTKVLSTATENPKLKFKK